MLELVFVIMHGCDNICVLLGHCNCIGEVMSVIEMVVDEKNEVRKVGMVVTKEWRKAKSAEMLEFVFVLAAEIIQVLDSIAWVRCASGNVTNTFLRKSVVWCL